MLENDAEGVAVCEAHEDPEVFRMRLGKALESVISIRGFSLPGAVLSLTTALSIQVYCVIPVTLFVDTLKRYIQRIA